MSYYAYRSTARRGRAAPGKRGNSGGSRSAGGRQPKKTYINPSMFVRKAKPVVQTEYIPQNSFADFAVHPVLHNNLAAIGYVSPSPIQDQTIPVSLTGKDIVGIANTGTGKTAAFAIPVLHRLMTEPRSKVIMLAPTRELAEQIEEQCRTIAKGSSLTGALLIGGAPIGKQLRQLEHNPRVIIGTPGRIKDHMERGSLRLNNFNIVVLDEVDRMLDMGFVNDITHILSQTSPTRQSLYFSATLDARVTGIIRTFSNDPVHVSVKSADSSEQVEQNVVAYRGNDHKIDQLHNILIADGTTKTIIFDDTQRIVERLSKELADRGFMADSIHGGKSQSQRQRVLQKFKDSKINVLVATDVAARGLDVSDITHVINYSLPRTYDDYVHRIGRTGRAGKTGYALTFIEA